MSPETNGPFTAAAGRPTPLDGEPPVYEVKHGTAPIIVIGPHNGHHVPRYLYDNGKPLGVEASWFDPEDTGKRHEACDWGVTELFSSLTDTFNEIDCTVMSANYSRLVCDLNRSPNYWLTTRASELDIEIPGNNDLLPPEQALRRNRFRTPWFDGVNTALTRIKDQHGYAVIIDLHSFTPTWHGTPRDTDIGSLRLAKTALSEQVFNPLLKTACRTLGLKFQDDAPYSLRTDPRIRETFAAETISADDSAIHYYGLETNSAHLQAPQTRTALARTYGEGLQRALDWANKHLNRAHP